MSILEIAKDIAKMDAWIVTIQMSIKHYSQLIHNEEWILVQTDILEHPTTGYLSKYADEKALILHIVCNDQGDGLDIEIDLTDKTFLL